MIDENKLNQAINNELVYQIGQMTLQIISLKNENSLLKESLKENINKLTKIDEPNLTKKVISK